MTELHSIRIKEVYHFWQAEQSTFSWYQFPNMAVSRVHNSQMILTGVACANGVHSLCGSGVYLPFLATTLHLWKNSRRFLQCYVKCCQYSFNASFHPFSHKSSFCRNSGATVVAEWHKAERTRTILLLPLSPESLPGLTDIPFPVQHCHFDPVIRDHPS